jgi:hypothetical protein
MGWAARANPRLAQIAAITAYVRANPDVARALYEKQVHGEPLPKGTIIRAIAAITQDQAHD